MTYDRVVTLVCTDNGNHHKQRLDVVGIRDGSAISLQNKGIRALRRHYVETSAGREISAFDLSCPRCSRRPQATVERMTPLIEYWLAEAPADASRVRVDISEPTRARLF